MPELLIPMAASGLCAPVLLVELQTAAGATYFWSEHKAVWPSLITGAPVQFLDWLMDAEFDLVGTTETDTAQFIVQNLSGNTVQRDAMMAFSTTELIGALVVARIWNGAAMTSLFTFVGSVTEAEPNENAMTLHVEGFGNWSMIEMLDDIDVSCPLTFGSMACGSVAPTPCDQTYGNCTSINRFRGVVTQWDVEAPNVQMAQPAPLNTFNPRERILMALNPQFQSQGTRKLPLGFGYVFGSGDNDLSTTAMDGSQYKRFLLGEGEWDGPQMINNYALAATTNGSLQATGPHMWSPPVQNSDVLNPINPAAAAATFADYLHFHSGAWTPIGTSIPIVDPFSGLIPPNTSQSSGPDQGYDEWLQNFPTVLPPQSMSGIAYAIWGAPGPLAAYNMWLAWPPPQGPQSYGSWLNSIYQAPTISGMAVWRALRCRIFDAYGNVLSYGFTCNPAWHKVEAILRRKIKPEQPSLAGLTDAEKACFNWESIAELATRNDFILPNGKPRFTGNYLFAADMKLTAMMETMCRVDRSFQRIDNGKIVLQGDDARASVFVASAKHLVPNTLNLDKKDVSKQPNIFMPQYRDLEVPAVCTVESGVSYGGYFLSGRHILGFRALTASTASPFTTGQYMRYGGCSDPSWDGSYAVAIMEGDPYPIGTNFPTTTYAIMSTPDGTPIENVAGGYLGSDDARFSQRLPNVVQHRSAQMMKAAQSPGLPSLPTKIRVMYDCGNSTFDQTNRLMKFERDRSLGTDIGAGWKAPICGTLSLFYEAVDVNGAQLPLQAKTHNVLTLDNWLYPEAPGDYEIMSMKVRPPRGDSPGQIDLTVHAYNRNAYTDVSDPPGSYYMAVPNSSLQLTGAIPVTPKPAVNWGFAFGLQSTGPGSNAAGNVTTIYYADATLTVGDPALIAAFNSGAPVYLSQKLTDAPAGMTTPSVVQVTSIGVGQAPDPVLGPTRPFYYYTYIVPTVASLWGSGHGGFAVNYQQVAPGGGVVTPAPNVAWVLNATLSVTDNVADDGTVDIAIPDLLVQVVGQVAPTAYPGFLVQAVPPNTPVSLYVTDPSGVGTAPTYNYAPAPFSRAAGSGIMVVAGGSFSG